MRTKRDETAFSSCVSLHALVLLRSLRRMHERRHLPRRILLRCRPAGRIAYARGPSHRSKGGTWIFTLRRRIQQRAGSCSLVGGLSWLVPLFPVVGGAHVGRGLWLRGSAFQTRKFFSFFFFSAWRQITRHALSRSSLAKWPLASIAHWPPAAATEEDADVAERQGHHHRGRARNAWRARDCGTGVGDSAPAGAS